MRRGFAVRLDQAGTRSTGGKAADCETYVTEYLRDRIVDLEEQVKRGGGSGSNAKLVQQISDMETETRAAVRHAAESDRLRKELQHKIEQIEILTPLAERNNPGLVQRLSNNNNAEVRCGCQILCSFGWYVSGGANQSIHNAVQSIGARAATQNCYPRTRAGFEHCEQYSQPTAVRRLGRCQCAIAAAVANVGGRRRKVTANLMISQLLIAG